MTKLNWLYRQINLLSLDIAAGVVLCALFFAKIFQVQIRLQGLITLGLTVWIVYTADHLLDAYKTKTVASTDRHRFHQQNQFVLLILLSVAVVVNIVLIFFIREAVFVWGVFLIAVVVLYLLLQKHLRFFKELIAALLYTSGVVLPSLAVTTMPLDFFMIVLMIHFFITAWFNLVLFSWFDEEKDIRDKHHSFVTTVGDDRTKYFLFLVFSFQAALFIFQIIYSTPWLFPLCILLTMNVILLIILLNKKWFAVDDRFRLVGDAVFLLPILFLV